MSERDPRDCGADEEPCGSPDCGRCLPVCNTCGGEHLTKDHGLRDTADGINEDAWDRTMGGGPSTFDVSALVTRTVEDWRRAGAL